jgi:hypothetical protein
VKSAIAQTKPERDERTSVDDYELPSEAIEEKNEEAFRDKNVALLISILAVFLALTEILSQQSQVMAVQKNIEASNQWAFFQGKAERESTYTLAIDLLEALRPNLNADTQHNAQENIQKWRAINAKLHDDPEKHAGTVQLFERAKAAEAERDRAEVKHGRYELASAALHIGIVLASASIITEMSALITGSIGLTIGAIILIIAGFIA